MYVLHVRLGTPVNGKAAISPEMALRLERWLGAEHGGRASVWLAMQTACDLWDAQRTAKAVLKKIKPVERVPA